MLSRRNFIAATAGAGLALQVPAADAQAPAAQPARKRMIVDAQVHLWKAQAADRPWRPNAAPQLPYPWLIENLIPMMDEAGVDRVVIVPPSWEGERNDYALEAAKRHPGRFGVMGRIAIESKDAPAQIPTWKSQPGMLGIRVTFQGEAARQLTDGTTDWFWPAAEKAGIPIMFLTAGLTPHVARIAERNPGLALIIDHMGLSNAYVKEGKRAQAIDEAITLAKYPNVSIKLSSASAYSEEAYPFRDMTPFIRKCFDAFGPRRCYWGTDMTNSLAKASYRQRIAHFTEELTFLSEADRDWVMGRAILARLGWAA
jgi:predicted TIM-barrel fold metal-dependent hydrolase